MIIFAWKGFPQYAARCVGAFVKSTTEKVMVVATRPAVPVEGMERVCNCPVVWVDEKLKGCNVEKLKSCDGLDELFNSSTLQPFNITLIVSGWSVPAFNRLAAEVRAKGGRVICMNDANYVEKLKGCKVERLKGCRVERLKQFARAMVFRVKYRKLFDGFLVPGKSARKLQRYYGVADEKIAEGMYSADESLFDPAKVDAAKKEKRIVYVGQYIDRKNVLAVCKAFEQSGIAAKGWSLEMYGSGPFKAQIPYAQPFVQPEQLPEIYRRARAFILASKEEHWGLVVHEAALSGCYLMLSDRVGAADDLLGEKNGVKFDPFNLAEMTAAFRRLAEMGEAEWADACAASLKLGQSRGLSSFVAGVRQTLKM